MRPSELGLSCTFPSLVTPFNPPFAKQPTSDRCPSELPRPILLNHTNLPAFQFTDSMYQLRHPRVLSLLQLSAALPWRSVVRLFHEPFHLVAPMPFHSTLAHLTCASFLMVSLFHHSAAQSRANPALGGLSRGPDAPQSGPFEA